MENIKSVLQLEKLYFDEIKFKRTGFQNNNKPEIGFQSEIAVNTAIDDKELYKIVLSLRIDKREEYEILITLNGIFSFNSDEELDSEVKKDLVSNNTISIMMPYIRSEVSLLTAQPEMECMVLPPLNINALLDAALEEQSQS